MTDKERGSDAQLPAEAPVVIERQIADEEWRWADEQTLIEMQPLLDDPPDDLAP